MHLAQIREIYHQDRRAGVAGVYLPYALERKYPEAGKEWACCWTNFQGSSIPFAESTALAKSRKEIKNALFD